MSSSYILPSGDSVGYIETSVSNFDNFFQITFDISNIDSLNINNVYYGVSNNTSIFEGMRFSNAETKSGNESLLYIDQCLKRDLTRHVLFESADTENTGLIPFDKFWRNDILADKVMALDEKIEHNFQTTFTTIHENGVKMSNDISGSPYQYYYNLIQRLFELTLSEQSRRDILEHDISLERQANPSEQMITVNLKFNRGDALMVYTNYEIITTDVSNIMNNIEKKSYRTLISLI